MHTNSRSLARGNSEGTDKVIGSVDFNHQHEDDVLEIGYTLHPDYWGRGYVPEAARALIDLAFKELDLHKIELSCFGYNLQSQRVAEKLGLTSSLNSSFNGSSSSNLRSSGNPPTL